jgi:TRAP-type uncharacterized transport system fused permease subunit
MRLCLVGFALPIIWIYHPEIFLDAVTWQSLPVAAATFAALLLAIVAFNAAHIGQFMTRLTVVHRVLLAVAAFFVVYPNWIVQCAAIVAIAGLMAERYVADGRSRLAVAATRMENKPR